jgi:hypothetical protein
VSDPKLHHYVPQFHLRRFADPRGKVWVWDKTRDRTFRAAPTNIAAEQQFYRLIDFEGLGHDPLTMEKQFSDLEGEVAKITDQWLEWLPAMAPAETVPIPEVNREIVSLHLALQYLRTSDTRDILAALARSDGVDEVSVEERRRLHLELLWDQPTVQRLTASFSQATWVFAVNSTDTPYQTSDNPIAFRTADRRRWVRMGAGARDAYATFPLSPTVMMSAFPQDPPFDALTRFADCRSPVPVSAEMVESDNTGQVFMATRFVVSPRDDFAAAKAFAPTIGTDNYKVPGDVGSELEP